jgi:hypothetical protein
MISTCSWSPSTLTQNRAPAGWNNGIAYAGRQRSALTDRRADVPPGEADQPAEMLPRTLGQSDSLRISIGCGPVAE